MMEDLLCVARALSEIDQVLDSKDTSRGQMVRLHCALASRALAARMLLDERPKPQAVLAPATETTGDLSAKRAAEALDVPEWRIYKLARQGKLPGHYHVGRSLRIPRKALEAVREGAV